MIVRKWSQAHFPVYTRQKYASKIIIIFMIDLNFLKGTETLFNNVTSSDIIHVIWTVRSMGGKKHTQYNIKIVEP